jgi:hypothetical protein
MRVHGHLTRTWYNCPLLWLQSRAGRDCGSDSGVSMVRKRLLILANSVKDHEHCIAGREIIASRDGCTLGPWIRPVSSHGQGELDASEIACADGSQVNVRDYAEVTLTAAVKSRFQPENWTIAGPGCWRKLERPRGRITRGALVESPRDLWYDRYEDRTDRILHARLVLKPPAQSLYVIRPEKLCLKFYAEFNAFKGKETRKHRASFVYNDVEYDLALTDPVASDKYGGSFPPVGAPPKLVPLSAQVAPLVCVSLTADFNGFHYKVAATIIE